MVSLNNLKRRAVRAVKRNEFASSAIYTREGLKRPKPPMPREGEVVGPPDFIGVSAQKAGTTWWFSLLLRHPDIALPSGQWKELSFFDATRTEPNKRLAVDYAQYFPREPGKLSGEWTPTYLSDFPWFPRVCRAAAPDAKLLVMLRDPVARFRSGMKHSAHVGAAVGHQDTLAANLNRGFYAAQLAALHEHWPEDQVLVLQYEKCRSDPMRQLRRTWQFLGVELMDVPDDALSRRVNSRPSAHRFPFPLDDQDVRQLYAADTAELGHLAPALDLELWR